MDRFCALRFYIVVGIEFWVQEGSLWIDSLFCLKEDLDDYLEAFKMPRNGKNKRIAVPKLNKNGRQVFFSAVPEKPLRPIRYQHMPKPMFFLVSDSGSPISLASTLSPYAPFALIDDLLGHYIHVFPVNLVIFTFHSPIWLISAQLKAIVVRRRYRSSHFDTSNFLPSFLYSGPADIMNITLTVRLINPNLIC